MLACTYSNPHAGNCEPNWNMPEVISLSGCFHFAVFKNHIKYIWVDEWNKVYLQYTVLFISRFLMLAITFKLLNYVVKWFRCGQISFPFSRHRMKRFDLGVPFFFHGIDNLLYLYGISSNEIETLMKHALVKASLVCGKWFRRSWHLYSRTNNYEKNLKRKLYSLRS